MYLLIILFLVLFVLGFGNFYKEFTGKTPSPSPSLIVSLHLNSIEVRQGEELIVTVKIARLESKEIEDVHIKYKIWDLYKEKNFWESSETAAILTSISVVKHIPISGDIPKGDYILEVEAESKGERAVASNWFSVSKKSPVNIKEATIMLVLLIIIIFIIIIYIEIVKLKKHYKK